MLKSAFWVVSLTWQGGCSTNVRWQWITCSRSGMREGAFSKLGSQPWCHVLGSRSQAMCRILNQSVSMCVWYSPALVHIQLINLARLYTFFLQLLGSYCPKQITWSFQMSYILFIVYSYFTYAAHLVTADIVSLTNDSIMMIRISVIKAQGTDNDWLSKA